MILTVMSVKNNLPDLVSSCGWHIVSVPSVQRKITELSGSLKWINSIEILGSISYICAWVIMNSFSQVRVADMGGRGLCEIYYS